MILKTKKTLKGKGLKPVKYRGQNFLVSRRVLKKIIAAAKIKAGETILEIGPGTGNLTQELSNAGAKVMAVEKDKNLAEILKLKIENRKIKIIVDDVLKFDEIKISRPYRVVANIPYYLTGQLIKKFLLSSNKPTDMILMVQKEVAERLVAQPPKTNFLSSLVQFLAEPKILFAVKKENFWPRPKVDSALIKIIPREHDFGINPDQFIIFLKVVFRQPRQTLLKNLKRGGWVTKQTQERVFIELGLEKNIRPQNLSVEQLAALLNSVKSKKQK